MTVKLSPEILLEAPRRTHPIPNVSGDLAVYVQTCYSFKSHTTKREIRILDLHVLHRSWPVTESVNVKCPQWLGHSSKLIWLESTENGHTNFVVGDARLVDEPYVVGTIPGPVSNLRITNVAFREDDDDDLAFVVTGKANLDGSFFDPLEHSQQSSDSSGRLYTNFPGRHADAFRPQKDVLWFGPLSRPTGTSEGRYTMGGITNLMKYYKLGAVALHIDPNAEGDEFRDFDISPWAITFVARDTETSTAINLSCSCYVCPMLRWDGFYQDALYHAFRHRGLGGIISRPVLKPDSTEPSFLSKKNGGYNSDKSRIISILDNHTGQFKELFHTKNGEELWDLSPTAIVYGFDKSMLIQVEERGRKVLYKLRLDGWGPNEPTPAALELVAGLQGSIIDVIPIVSSSSKSRLLASCESFNHSREYLVVDSATTTNPQSKLGSVASSSRDEYISLPSQIDEIWLTDANSTQTQTHAWIIKPSSFDSDKKYPLALFLHDGPQDAWIDQWCLNWNLMVFAEQGYVVVAPNPTGSTSYGQPFTDGIKSSWGGSPYAEIEKVFDHIQTLGYVDTERAVALGNGYGGYMINWLQGQEFGRRFKALVTHAGIFSMTTQLASDIQVNLHHDFGGPPWTNPAEWQKWDPVQHAGHWETPHLIIHNELDCQTPIAQGLAAFHTLQMKGIKSELLTFPDEGHHVRKPENLLLWYQTVIRWMNEHVK